MRSKAAVVAAVLLFSGAVLASDCSDRGTRDSFGLCVCEDGFVGAECDATTTCLLTLDPVVNSTCRVACVLPHSLTFYARTSAYIVSRCVLCATAC